MNHLIYISRRNSLGMTVMVFESDTAFWIESMTSKGLKAHVGRLTKDWWDKQGAIKQARTYLESMVTQPILKDS